MNKLIKYLLFLLLIFFIGCKEEGRIDFIDTAKDAPEQIKNISIEPTSGGAVVTFSVPNDENFLYAKAVYEAPVGVRREARSSRYTDTLKLEGYGDMDSHDVSFFSVGKNTKESLPIVKNFNPLSPPATEVANKLDIRQAFGGIQILYSNESESNIIIELLVDSLGTGEWEMVERLYTKANNGKWAIRGLEAIERDYAVTVRDPFGNQSELIQKTITPLFEIEIPKDDFMDLRLPNDTKSLRPQNPITHLWDNIITPGTNFFATDQGKDPLPKWISIDFGSKYVLSRLKQWQRYNEEYIDGRKPSDWEIYGSNAPNPDGSWESWTLLQHFGEAHKPSGSPGGVRTNEDIEYAQRGVDYEFEVIPPAYRFYRIKWNKSRSGENFILIAEITFWGQHAE